MRRRHSLRHSIAAAVLAAALPAVAMAAGAGPAGNAAEAEIGADIPWVLKLYEGIRAGDAKATAVATSSYVQPAFFANLKDDAASEEEIELLRSTFNLQSVQPIAQGGLMTTKPGGTATFFAARGQGRTLTVILSRVPGRPMVHEVEVLEKDGGASSLLKTQFTVPRRFTTKDAVVFGFEDERKTPLFLSLRPGWGGVEGGVIGGVRGGVEGGGGGVQGGRVGGVIGGVVGGILVERPKEESQEDTVRAIGEIKPPKLVKVVEPAYPAIAEQARVEGVVILEVRTDEAGSVTDARVLRSIPLLDQAAVDAVRQWKYEPLIINGKPRPVLFTVTVRFEPPWRAAAAPAPKAEAAEQVNPVLKVYFEPVYPAAAGEKKVSGTVLVEIRLDAAGNVADARVLKSIPALDQAALEAVRKWKYEPVVVDGRPQEVVITVRVSFGPNRDEPESVSASIH